MRDPFGAPSLWYLLIEASGGEGSSEAFTQFLAKALEEGIISDATVASSEAQRNEIWRIREAIVESQKREGGSIKNDVSVPISQVPDFIAEASKAVVALIPDARPLPFGHIGDGNIHFNISQPPGMDKQAFLERWDDINKTVYDVVIKHGGSFSAEHGIGRLKVETMRKIKSPVELDIMRGIKSLLDPLGILNPGKVIPP